MKTFKFTITLIALFITVALVQSCKNKNPSVAKVFVRSSSNELLSDAKVVIIAEVKTNESDIEYVDTLITNTSGYVQFDLKDYFEQAGKEVEVATFRVICRKGTLEGIGKIRTRIYTTAVETIHVVQ